MGVPKPKRRKNGNSPARRRVLLVGVACFLLVDAGLVAFALTATEPVSSAGTVATAPTAAPPSVEPAEAPVVDPVKISASATVVPTRILAALDGSTAWRATTGGCPATSADPELTTDSGATWKSFNASTKTGASSILAINVADTATMSLVTLDATACAPQVVTTFVAGDAWKAYPERAAAEWYVNPATPGTVHTPGGDLPAPCDAVAVLAVTDESTAAALCLDASVLTTADAGASWSVPVSVPGATAITAVADGYEVALVNPSGCVGVTLVAVSPEGAVDATSGACIPATVGLGETAVAADDDGTLWLWAGDTFVRSTDGGATWA